MSLSQLGTHTHIHSVCLKIQLCGNFPIPRSTFPAFI